MSGPIHVLSINYFAQGLTAPCTLIQILPDPNEPSGEIVTVNCFNEWLVASGRGLIINPTPDCDDCGEIPVADESSTWGNVKGLYAN
ncbi:hypothetical protein H8E07_08520 [bacterium]|nr:hypothetical protein [bacterium]